MKKQATKKPSRKEASAVKATRKTSTPKSHSAVLEIDKVGIVFSPDYTVFGIYDRDGRTLLLREKLFEIATTKPKFWQFQLDGQRKLELIELTASAGKLHAFGAGTSKQIQDVWNNSGQLIVGTGDLRAGITCVVLETFEIVAAKSIILSSTRPGRLEIYDPSKAAKNRKR